MQVQELFFRPRDKDGNIRRDPDKIGKVIDPREEFIRHWVKWGLSRERASERWMKKIHKERQEKKRKRAESRMKR